MSVFYQCNFMLCQAILKIGAYMNPLELAFNNPKFVTLWKHNQSVRNFVATKPSELFKLVKLLKSIDELCLQ